MKLFSQTVAIILMIAAIITIIPILFLLWENHRIKITQDERESILTLLILTVKGL